jgi:uncharacterized protein YaaQ
MKLAVCIVHGRDKNPLADAMVKAGFKFTILSSHGGFLREGNATFLVGLEESELDNLKGVVQENCQSREQVVNVSYFDGGTPGATGFMGSPVNVPVGGAVMFVVNVDEFLRF